MNSEKLIQKLMAAARADVPANEVPPFFEKRILARVQTRPTGDTLALWSRSLWRAAVACLAIPLLLGLWTATSSDASGADTSFAQAFEDTVYAPVAQQLLDIAEW